MRAGKKHSINRSTTIRSGNKKKKDAKRLSRSAGKKCFCWLWTPLFLFEEKEIFHKIFRQYGRKIGFYWKNCANFIEKSETGWHLLNILVELNSWCSAENGGFWMTNPTAGYSYNICVNDNDFGGACMKRLRFTADMTKEQKRNTVAKQWFRTSANTAFRATYPSPQAPTYATVSCTMCFTCAQRNIRTSAQASSTYRSHASR